MWNEKRGVMEDWARKLRTSGYPATTRHQVIKEAVKKYEKICVVEDEGGRPVHRAREWQQAARRLDKETSIVSLHKLDPSQISAPLIIDPTQTHSKAEGSLQRVPEVKWNLCDSHVVSCACSKDRC